MRPAATQRYLFPLLMALASSASSAWSAEIVPVEAVGGQGKVRLSGSVIPYKTVTLTAQVPGRIDYIAGEVGARFDADAVLVAVNSDDLQAKRQAAVAQLQQAEASLRDNYVQYNRELWSPQSQNPGRAPGMGMPFMFDQFFTRGFGNMMGYGNQAIDRQADLSSQSAQLSQAQAQVQRARSQIGELDVALRNARSQAPFEGVILEKLIEAGDTVTVGQPLLKFGHTKYLRVQVEAPARLVPQMNIGDIVPAYLDASKQKSEARLSQIYPQADASRHTVTVKFDLPEGTAAGPGMYAEVDVPDSGGPSGPMPVIPKTAILKGGSLPGVLMVMEDRRSELRIVRLGSAIDANRVAVLSGLVPGDRIIDNPPAGATSGWMPDMLAPKAAAR